MCRHIWEGPDPVTGMYKCRLCGTIAAKPRVDSDVDENCDDGCCGWGSSDTGDDSSDSDD